MAGKGRLADQRPCEVCGRAFQPILSALKRGRGKTCSVPCRIIKWSQRTSAEARRKGQLKRDSATRPRGIKAGRYLHGLYVGYREAPHVRRAHAIVTKAIKEGRLIRQPCESCGATEKVEAHHDDYDKPLEIRWLCFVCHREFHRIVAQQSRKAS